MNLHAPKLLLAMLRLCMASQDTVHSSAKTQGFCVVVVRVWTPIRTAVASILERRALLSLFSWPGSLNPCEDFGYCLAKA